MINKYQISCQGQLDEVTDTIGSYIGQLQEMIMKKDNLLKNKINEYKQQVNNIRANEQKLVRNLDEVMENVQNSIDEEKQNFEDKIVLCQDVVKKYGNDYDVDIDNERQRGLEKIGAEAKIYYDEKIQEINDDKSKVTEFINRKPIEHEEKDA